MRRASRTSLLEASVAVSLSLLSCSQSDDWISTPLTPPAADCTVRCGSAECPCPGSTPIPVDGPNGARFAIDATEVTVLAYSQFLDGRAPPPRETSDPKCAWNESYVPAVTSLNLDPNCETSFDYEALLADAPDRPVACVDLCDARDYCAWAGGHLCGAIEGGVLTGDTRNTDVDAWYVACSLSGAQPYAYGDTFDVSACNVDGNPAGGMGADTVSVATLPGCEGPLAGLHDMNGNVKEWLDYCEDAEDLSQSVCYRVGGAFFEGEAAQSRCDATTLGFRATAGKDTGVRCCYPR